MLREESIFPNKVQHTYDSRRIETTNYILTIFSVVSIRSDSYIDHGVAANVKPYAHTYNCFFSAFINSQFFCSNPAKYPHGIAWVESLDCNKNIIITIIMVY